MAASPRSDKAVARRPHVARTLIIVGALATGCERADTPRTAASGSPAGESVAARPYRPGVRFDPARIAVGDRIAGVVVDSLAVRQAFDSTLVGVARFRGEIALTGRTLRHHDHPEVRAVCFEADSASGERLPRWRGDERRPWFCFDDLPRAERLLAPPGVERDASIVVDRFTINAGKSDEVNSARLVVVRPP